jgi:hypothetical protein
MTVYGEIIIALSCVMPGRTYNQRFFDDVQLLVLRPAALSSYRPTILSYKKEKIINNKEK